MRRSPTITIVGMPMPPMSAEYDTSSWRPRKYQGALAGFSGTAGFASSFNGASATSERAAQMSVVNMKTPASP